MKKSILFSLVFSGLLIGIALFMVPAYHSFAAPAVINIEKGPGLVQCGRLNFGPKFCDMCDLIVLVKAALDFIWRSAWVIAAGMMIYGGFYMILPSFGGGGSGMFEKGKKILTNVAWGLVIVFFAWIAIDTIIKVVAGQSLTSGAPATLPQSTNTTTFESQATPDLMDVPGQVTVPRFSISFGPWNKISCTRAPERAPLALLSIPPEFQCVDGKPVKPIPGFDPCEEIVMQNIQAWQSGNGESQVNIPLRGTCTNGVLSTHNTSTVNIPNLIQYWANNYGLDTQLLQSFIIHESGGNPRATSRTGVVGLGQVTVGTAQRLEPSLRSLTGAQIQQRMINEPSLSIRLSADLLRRIRDNPYVRGDTGLMAVAYNAGEGAIIPASGTCSGKRFFQCPGSLSPAKAAEVEGMISGVNGNLNQIRNGSCNP